MMSPTNKASLQNIPSLDGLRALAALMVMAFHFMRPTLFPNWAIKCGLFGQTGVDLFFVLSGFLITRILVDMRGDQTGSLPYKLRIFYTRRALRIFPLYYGYLILHFFVFPLIGWSQSSPLREQWWGWVYCQNIPATFPELGASSAPGHFWSLAIEEHYYLAWPLLLLFFSPKNILKISAGILIFSLALRYLVFASGHEVYYFTLTRLDAITFGSLLALGTANGVPRILKQAWRLALVVLPCVLFLFFTLFSGKQNVWIQTFKLSAIPCFYAALIGWCVFDERAQPLRQALECKPLRKLGMIAYGLYVFHPLVFMLSDAWVSKQGLWLHTLAAFLGTALVAALSYLLFEKPFLKLKRFFAYAKETQ